MPRPSGSTATLPEACAMGSASEGGAPETSSWHASMVMPAMLVAPSAIATAMDSSATPQSTCGDFPHALAEVEEPPKGSQLVTTNLPSD